MSAAGIVIAFVGVAVALLAGIGIAEWLEQSREGLTVDGRPVKTYTVDLGDRRVRFTMRPVLADGTTPDYLVSLAGVMPFYATSHAEAEAIVRRFYGADPAEGAYLWRSKLYHGRCLRQVRGGEDLPAPIEALALDATSACSQCGEPVR